MAIKEMSRDSANSTWFFNESKAAAGAGDSVLIPPEAKEVIVSLEISSGSGYVQASLSSRDAVIAGTATWINWDEGTVSSTKTSQVAGAVSAVRQYNVSLTTVLNVRAK